MPSKIPNVDIDYKGVIDYVNEKGVAVSELSEAEKNQFIHDFNEKNELHNRNLHISGLLNKEKVDIESEKVDIGNMLRRKGNVFTKKTTDHIQKLFEKFSFDGVFGRSNVMEFLGLKSSGTSKLLSNLVQADIIKPVSGYGKGKYKFNEKLLLAWDPDFTKVTPEERSKLDKADEEMKKGEYFTDDEVWN